MYQLVFNSDEFNLEMVLNLGNDSKKRVCNLKEMYVCIYLYIPLIELDPSRIADVDRIKPRCLCPVKREDRDPQVHPA